MQEPPSVRNFKEICRTCLIHLESGYFAIYNVTRENISLKDILNIYACLEDNESDNMPSNMCNDCIEKIYEAHNFLSTCKKSREILKGMLNDTTNKDLPIKKEAESDDENDNSEIPFVSVEVHDTEEIKEEGEKDSESPNSAENVEKPADTPMKKKKYKDPQLDNILKDTFSKPKNSRIKGPPFKCIACEASFQLYSDWKLHKIALNHRTKMKMECSYCKKKFDNRNKYERHVGTHSSEKPFVCESCGKGFKSKYDLRKHAVVHADGMPFTCLHCNKGFSRKQTLIAHLNIHRGALPFICPFCGKSYYSQSSLRNHENLRHKPKPKSTTEANKEVNQCDICGNIYSSKKTLKSHLLHHGEKKYSCKLCGQMFFTGQNLRKHITSGPHGVPKFSCAMCDKEFKRNTLMLNHMKSHHVHPCELCDKRFSFKKGLAEHMKQHHSKEEELIPSVSSS